MEGSHESTSKKIMPSGVKVEKKYPRIYIYHNLKNLTQSFSILKNIKTIKSTMIYDSDFK